MEHCANGDRSAVQAQTRPSNEQENLEIWVPITAPRKAKWWYSTFHNVTAMVGAGVLGLPYAMSQLGWVPGVAAILLSWVVTFYSQWQLVEMHGMVPGKRFGRYLESASGEHVLGPKMGFWMEIVYQLAVQLASTIVYCVTGGKSLKKFCDLINPALDGIRQTYYILFFVLLQMLLSQILILNTFKGISLLAAVMPVCYSMVAFGTSFVKGIDHSPTHHGLRSHTVVGRVFDTFNALGTIAFAFAGHDVALEIQATLPSTKEDENPSKKAMWRGVIAAYTIVIVCYLSVAISGFWAFGNAVEDDVLVSLEHPRWLIATANLMVFIHLTVSFQVFSMRDFNMIDSSLAQKWSLTPSASLRLIARSLYGAVVGFVAICVPFFGGLLGYFGGLAFASSASHISALWLVAKKPKAWSIHWTASLICLVVGCFLLVLAPIGGFRTLYVSGKTYKMFS